MGGVVASFLELVAYGTGELLLYVLTLGKRRPRLPYEKQESSVAQELLFQGSTWLGFIFWATLIAALLFVFAR